MGDEVKPSDNLQQVLRSGRIASACIRVGQILESDQFREQAASHPLFVSGVTELVIHLRDLLRLAEDFDQHLTWHDDIPKGEPYKNISELIVFFRIGLTHAHTFHRRFGGESGTQVNPITHRGKGWVIWVGNLVVNSQYEDDTGIFIGHHRIYLRRHIVRAFRELQAIFRHEGINAGPAPQ